MIRLVGLSLAENQIVGAMPPELGQLSNLTTLFLNDNQITGLVPQQLYKLPNITHFRVEGNQITDPDREALVALYNAADGQDWRMWRGGYPQWLSDEALGEWDLVTTDVFGRVTELNLWMQHLTGQLPPEFFNLSNLKNLRLSDNGLSGEIPPEVG